MTVSSNVVWLYQTIKARGKMCFHIKLSTNQSILFPILLVADSLKHEGRVSLLRLTTTILKKNLLY